VILEIQRRIQNANRCFFGLRKHLQSKHLSRQTKFTIHKTLIRPVLLYGSETWVLTKIEDKQLLVFERKVLRTICGPKIENGVYRRRYNPELEREFDSPNDLNVTKTSRLRPKTYYKKLYSEANPLEGEITYKLAFLLFASKPHHQRSLAIDNLRYRAYKVDSPTPCSTTEGTVLFFVGISNLRAS
jgi:hypothetical protein